VGDLVSAVVAVLVEYHRGTGKVCTTNFFGPNAVYQAMTARFNAEQVRMDPELEIVVLVSDSLRSIHKTHSRYFMGGSLP
jgi:hypothetical protein